MKTITIIITLGLVTFLTDSTKAQKREVAHNNNIWLFQYTKIPLPGDLSFENELHLRLADEGSMKQQILIRPSIAYQLNQHVVFNLGYTHIETYPYGDQPVPIRIPENNVWGQVTLKHDVGNLQFSHRYRLEQRWSGKVVSNADGSRDISGTIHRNRVRYRITVARNLGDRYYANAFNEVWIKFGENKGLNAFDQNWAYLGFGRKLTKTIRAELGYLWQLLDKEDGIHSESNQTLQITAKYILTK